MGDKKISGEGCCVEFIRWATLRNNRPPKVSDDVGTRDGD